MLDPGLAFRFTTVVTLVTGTMFLMWLGEQITERGLGNGISIIIFAGIAAGLPNAIGGTLELVRTGAMSILLALLICWSARSLVTGFVVFVERGQRKILVNYAKRQVGQQGLWRPELAPAAEAEHVGRDPADLRVVASSCSRRRWRGWFGTQREA